MRATPGQPILAYFGHHKAATSWISGIVREVCDRASLKMKTSHYEQFFDGDIEGLRRTNHFDFWCYTNADYTFVRYVNCKGFHVIRDPRDMIVSGYFSHLNTHPVEQWPRLRQFRRHLQTLSKEDGIFEEIEHFFSIFLSHMASWDYQTPHIQQIKFEKLITDPLCHFVAIFRFLGIAPELISLRDIERVVEKYAFQNISGGRSPGTENIEHHYRKGQPGDWKNHFTDGHIEYFKKRYNPLLIKLGYEKEEDW